MIAPYTAVALQTTVRHVTTRDEVEVNLDHIGNMIDLVTHICSLELPVRLITLGEGAIQGFVDEILDMGQAEYAETMAAEIPGPETDALAEKAKQKGCYILAQLKTKNDKYPGRFFNTVFLIDPAGDVIWQHQKNIVLHVEHSTTPHDVYDDWIAEHGDTLEAFFPVARTEIGNIAGTVGVEAAFPECYRAFAMNGAEIFYRGSLPEPWVSREIFEVQNRARAMDNTAYMLATNTGALIMPGPPGSPPITIDGALGGRSAIIDYKGHVLATNQIVGDCYVASEINIEALRHYRENARFGNWIPYLRTEIFGRLYDDPLWPKNQPPMQHADADRVFRRNVAELLKRGTFTKSRIDQAD
ncbi:MAG: hydrolase [Proteobacteria bacterium]|nr:MAG: hydrolase [Pseudomonadota bacterium]